MEEGRQLNTVTSSPRLSKARAAASTGARVSHTTGTTQRFEGDANVASNSPRLPAVTSSNPSTSEPTLRFPTPFGSNNLADWISNSDPDIKSSRNEANMRVNDELNINSVTVDGAGLSESTYELISGNTDTESQDGTYADSLMTGSMESLDELSRDDAASEHVVEEEEEEAVDEPTAIETTELISLSTDDETDTEELALNEEAAESAATLRPTTTLPQQNLRTPTRSTPAATPEASRVISPSLQDVAPETLGQLLAQHFLMAWEQCVEVLFRAIIIPMVGVYAVVREAEGRNAEWYRRFSSRHPDREQRKTDASPQSSCLRLVKRTSLGVLILMTAYATLFGLGQNIMSRTFEKTTEQTQTNISSTTLTTTTTTTIANSVATTAFDKVKALTAPEQDYGDMWFQKVLNPPPVVHFSSEGVDSVVVVVRPTIPKYWLGMDCVGVDSSRNGDMVSNQWEVTKHDTILVKFPSQDAHGLIEVKLKADCRPKFEKAVKVRFSKRGALEKVFDRAQNMSQDLKALVPTTDMIKQSFSRADVRWFFDHQGEQIKVASNRALQSVGQWKKSFASAAKDLPTMKSFFNMSAWREARDEMVKDMPIEKAQVALLDYQIPAKVLWLKFTAGQAAADEYKSKAKQYAELKKKKVSSAGRKG